MPGLFDYNPNSWSYADAVAGLFGGQVEVKWRTVPTDTSESIPVALTYLEFDLTPQFAETIVPGSVMFTLGGRTYVDRAGQLYYGVNPTTGSGTLGGNINYTTGNVRITDWEAGQPNTLAILSLLTQVNLLTCSSAVFRVPVIPVRSGSLQIRFNPVEETDDEIVVNADSSGNFSNTFVVGRINYQSGTVICRFGREVQITVANRASIEAKPWYNVAYEYTRSGNTYIFRPIPIYPDSLRYNAVGLTYLPLPADILGIDPVRLPQDGKVPIFKSGYVAVVHNTKKGTFASPAIGAVFNAGRPRLNYVRVYDAAGTPLSPAAWSANMAAGTVELTPSYSSAGLTLPITVEHRIEDAFLLTDVQVGGRMTASRQITHAYDATDTYVSSALLFGDTGARAYGMFSQTAWLGEWSDSVEGSTPTAQFDEINYPVTVKNRGAVSERWALIFTSSTAFRIVGEHLGQIGTGVTSVDVAPPNPNFPGFPYFTLPALGFGSGWSSGNVLRFNTEGGNNPAWVAMTIQQSAEPISPTDHVFELQQRGNIDV